MAIPIAEIRPGMMPYSVSSEIPFSPQKIELPIQVERLMFIAEGRGLYLPSELEPGYKEYEFHVFYQKATDAAKKGENCLYIDPVITDLILPQRDFEGICRPDFMMFKGNELAELEEVKAASEFINEYEAKADLESGFPKLLEIIRWDLAERVRKVIPSIYISNATVDPSNVRFRFISPTSQDGRTNFKRWRTPHEVIDPTPEIAAALIEEQVRQRAVAEQRKREKAELRAAKQRTEQKAA